MNPDSPREGNLRRPHPLAAELIARLHAFACARVLDFGAGSGRNTAALKGAGHEVCAVADDRVQDFRATGLFDAAVSTHALLHGTPRAVAASVQDIAAALKSGAPFYATFGSKADARYGKGTRIDVDAFAPESGDEQGVPHAYFDESALRTMLEGAFTIESMEEHTVDDVVGTWAHARQPQGTVHWFVRAHKRQ